MNAKPGMKRWLLSLLALTAVAAPAQDDELYHHPGGYFTLRPERGWTVESEPHAARLKKRSGNIAVLVLPTRMTPDSALQAQVGRLAPNWQKFQQTGTDAVKVAGIATRSVVHLGSGGDMPSAFVRIMPVDFPAHTIVVVSLATSVDYLSLRDEIRLIEQSLAPGRPASEPTSTPARPSAARGYQQPGGAGQPFPSPSPNSAVLGVNCRSLSPQDMATVAAGTTQGVLVMQVGGGTPAEQAGIQPGDVIVAVDGQPVLQPQHLVAIVGGRRPGDTVEIMLTRQGRPTTIRARLADRTAAGPPPAAAVMPSSVPPAPSQPVTPSQTLVPYQGPGFTLSVPDNWIGVLTNSRRIVRLGAAADLQPLAGREDEVPLGGSAGWTPFQAPDLDSAAARHEADITQQNPGARVLGRQRITVGNLPAESLLVESICTVLHQPQLTWILVVRPAAGPFFIHLGGPKAGFDALRPVFGSIVGSLRFAGAAQPQLTPPPQKPARADKSRK